MPSPNNTPTYSYPVSVTTGIQSEEVANRAPERKETVIFNTPIDLGYTMEKFISDTSSASVGFHIGSRSTIDEAELEKLLSYYLDEMVEAVVDELDKEFVVECQTPYSTNIDIDIDAADARETPAKHCDEAKQPLLDGCVLVDGSSDVSHFESNCQGK